MVSHKSEMSLINLNNSDRVSKQRLKLELMNSTETISMEIYEN